MELLAIISVIVLIYGIFKNLVLQKTQMICMQIMILFEQTVSAECRKKKLREMHRTDVTIFQKK